MQKYLKNILLYETDTVRDAIEKIDKGAKQLALVIDKEYQLLATVTDGDIRRGILRGVGFDESVREVMHKAPTVVQHEDGHDKALQLMRELKLHHIPVIDKEGRLVELKTIDKLISPSVNDTWVVLMAGGLGIRLRPLTETVPKPMLPIGGKPLLENTIKSLKEQGFRKFFISVNHQRHIIQDYFKNGQEFGVDIEYLVETDKLGTAGALSLLPEKPSKPFIIMNGDIMTSIKLSHLLKFNEEHVSDATICVREHVVQIPFGVVDLEGSSFQGIQEKPVHNYMVNAGIYILNPNVLDLIPDSQYCDMPTVFEALVSKGGKASVFPIREYWLDIGRFDDLRRAEDEYLEIFS